MPSAASVADGLTPALDGNSLRNLAFLVALALAAAACSPATSPPPSSSAGSPAASAGIGSSASPAVPVGTAPAATAPSTSDLYDVAGVGWESDFVFMEPHGFGWIKGLVGGGPGFLMWSDETGGRPGFLFSEAGRGWAQVDLTVTGRTMLTVAADRTAFLALASNADGHIELWRSPNGTTWTSAPTVGLDGTPTSMVMTGSGFAAAGRDRSGCGLASWTSTDAVTWTASGTLPGGTATCAVGAGAPVVDQLLAGPVGFLALGHLAGTEAIVWTSRDGRTWTRAPAPPAGRIAHVAQGPQGYVAVTDGGGTLAAAAVWTSPDGATWTAAPPQQSFDGATISSVVALAGGRFVAVGAAAAPGGSARFAAWTSTDGRTWQRSLAPLCQSIDVCNDRASQPPLLATDGQRLVAWDGSVNVLGSPRLTAGLRPATLTLAFDHPQGGSWSAGAAAGFCVPADDPPATISYGAGFPRLTDVGPASGTSTFVPSLQLELGEGGAVQLLMYDRGDDAGFTGHAAGPEPGAFVIGPDHVTVDAGSTPFQGRLEFRDVPVHRSDASLPSVPAVSGALRWSCG